MRHLLLICAAVLAMAAAVPSAQAERQPAPWCAVVSIGFDDAAWDCRYASFEACVPHVLAGNRGFCNLNPAYNGPVEQPRARKHWRPRHG